MEPNRACYRHSRPGQATKGVQGNHNDKSSTQRDATASPTGSTEDGLLLNDMHNYLTNTSEQGRMWNFTLIYHAPKQGCSQPAQLTLAPAI
jgi:hypothetical protein